MDNNGPLESRKVAPRGLSTLLASHGKDKVIGSLPMLIAIPVQNASIMDLSHDCRISLGGIP
jgi:hypothetical protein